MRNGKNKAFNLKKTMLAASTLLALSVSGSAMASVTTDVDSTTALLAQNLLRKAADCTNSSDCPSGAYYIDHEDGAAGLYGLGTLIGGGQDKLQNGKPVAAPFGLTTEWSPKRYAILIGTGHYQMPEPFKIGYYTQVMGVASNRSQVVVQPGVNVLNIPAGDSGVAVQPGGLNNFWRSLSDLTLNTTGLKTPDGGEANALRFGVSQSSAVRNIHVTGDKHLLMCDWNTGGNFDCGMTSGGFIANSKIDNELRMGSQQQYLLSNISTPKVEAGVWNIVLNNMPADTQYSGEGDQNIQNKWTGATVANTYPFTTTEDNPNNPSQYKPRLTTDGEHWFVQIGDGQKYRKSLKEFMILSPTLNNKGQLRSGTGITIVSRAEIKSIEAAMTDGKAGLVILPGMYEFKKPLKVPNNKVILGIGLPSLIAPENKSTMITGNQGVHIAGVVFDANVGDGTKDLLVVGNKNEAQPTSNLEGDVLQDVYCRVARFNKTMGSPSARACVNIKADYTYGQNLWLWRADHDAQTGYNPLNPGSTLVPWDIDQAENGLVVSANHVAIDGLAVEHFLGDQVKWLGDYGKVNFYQSELPYVVQNSDGSQPEINCDLDKNNKVLCPSFVIAGDHFQGFGFGVYSYFPKTYNGGQIQPTINAPYGIKVLKKAQDVKLTHIVNRWLNGDPQSGIESIIKIHGKTEGLAVKGPLQSEENGATLQSVV